MGKLRRVKDFGEGSGNGPLQVINFDENSQFIPVSHIFIHSSCVNIM
jgi:hypothetical protein